VGKYSVEAAVQGGEREPGGYEHKGTAQIDEYKIVSFGLSDYTRAASFR